MSGANLPTEASRNCAVLKPNERTRSKVVERASGCDHGAERVLVPADSGCGNPRQTAPL
jgi:hypothetical protein